MLERIVFIKRSKFVLWILKYFIDNLGRYIGTEIDNMMQQTKEDIVAANIIVSTKLLADGAKRIITTKNEILLAAFIKGKYQALSLRSNHNLLIEESITPNMK